MVALLEALPFLDGWEHRVVTFVAEEQNAVAPIVQPGGEQPILADPGAGWLVGALATFGSLYGKLAIAGQDRVATGDQNRLSASPFTLLNSGVTQPIPQGIHLTRYSKTVKTLQKTVPLVGTPLTLSDAIIGIPIPDDAKAVVQALPGNTGNVYLGDTQADALVAATRFSLAPKDSAQIKLQNINRVWLAVDVPGEGVQILCEVPDTINTTNAQFSLAFTPAAPLPYRHGLRVSVMNPATLPTAAGGGTNAAAMPVQTYYAASIGIRVESAFIDSLRKLMGSLSLSNGTALQGVMMQARDFAR